MTRDFVKVIFGGAVFDSTTGSFSTVEKTQNTLRALKEEGIEEIDTAQVYGQSESLLGQADASSLFVIDTKHCGGHIPGQSTKDILIARAKASLAELRTDHVHIFYLHSPDRNSDVDDALSGVNELYKTGAFKRFGLSNFLAHEVEEVVRIARKNLFVLPSVYQGSYSAISRKQETELLPILRKHSISFYAYSPLAGGFAKTREDIIAGKGRWDPSSLYGQVNLAMFDKPNMLRGLDAWDTISKKSGISKADLAYRWIVYHSALNAAQGDAVVIGASQIVQLRKTMEGLRDGGLPADTVEEINAVWDIVKDAAVLDPVNDVIFRTRSGF